MHKFVVPFVVAVLTLGVVLAPTFAQTAGFADTFGGRPAAPQPYQNPNNWDIMVFGVDSRQPNLAQHGPDCEPPGFPYDATNSHRISSASQAVFICNDHLMTSLGLAGYGAVYMTPPAVADFGSGPARIAWDMSTLRTSARDWIYVTITPFMERHELPYINSDQHIPPHNIRILLAGTNTLLVSERVGNSDVRVQQDDSTTWDDVFHAQSPASDESPTRRDTFEVQLSRTEISLCMPNYAYKGAQPFCWARSASLPQPLDPAIWGDQASVQFTHVTYNAEKACADDALRNGYDNNSLYDQYGIVHNAYGDQHCPPNTWHWDNVSITPAVAYSVIASDPPDLRVSSEAPSTVNFAAPAPENASLSFVSFGDTPQLAVSYDGGVTWLPPKFQEATAFEHPEVGEHVMMPIPQGQQSIMVRGARGYWGTFEAQAFKIVEPPAASAPGGAPNPNPVVEVPTPAATSEGTPSATSQPSVTPMPSVTAQVTPTVETTATVTPTPAAGTATETPTARATPSATATATRPSLVPPLPVTPTLPPLGAP